MSVDAEIGGGERYRLAGSLGQGGQGNTYEAVDVALGRPVAVKLITLRDSAWKQFDLFERECQVLKELSHPGIPRYLDTFSDEAAGRYALVMERVEGRSLKELLDARQLLTEDRVWHILEQALGILGYLHGLKPPVIHRDVKPANLILGPDDKLSLVDFGGVRVALRPDGGSTVVGTFGYMAPEQLHGAATPATDIFGLGATIATLLTGIEADKLPRKGLKIDLAQVLTAGPMRDVLTVMLEPEPDERPSSAVVVRRLIADLRSPKVKPQPVTVQPADGEPRPSEPASAEPQDPDARAGSKVALGVMGTLGWVALSAFEVVMLPVVVALLSLIWSNKPEKLRRLAQRSDRAKRWLKGGRESMKSLREGRRPDVPRRLPPHRERDARSDMRQLERDNRRSRNAQRHRGRRQGRRRQ